MSRKRAGSAPWKIFLLRAIPFLLILVGALVGIDRYVIGKYGHLINSASGDYILRVEKAAALRFAPNCSMDLRYADGFTHSMRTNEIGVRDRPMAEFRDGALPRHADHL